MPLDDSLAPSRLPALPSAAQVIRHFPAAFGIGVDVEGREALPPLERLRLERARLPEPPEAVLLDRVLQLVPPALLGPIRLVLILETRGTARMGGHWQGIVRVSAQEARTREGDVRYGNRFSLFTTTVLHEIGHAVWDLCLTPAQRARFGDYYLDALIEGEEGEFAADEPSEAAAEHHLVDLLLAALLGHGQPGFGAGMARRQLAALGLEVRQR